MHSKERVIAARVSSRNPTHRLHARKAYHQELLRSRAATNSPLKWSATSYALIVGNPCSKQIHTRHADADHRQVQKASMVVALLMCMDCIRLQQHLAA